MKIGMTYDLRSDYLKMGFSEEETAEFDREDTIDYIYNSLVELGHEVERIGNIYHLINKLGQGERWDLVFNICEGLYGIARESQVPSILDAFRIPYTFSDAMTLSISLHKGLTKQIIRKLRLPTAPYHLVQNMGQLKKIKLPYPLFAKPVAEGTGKGVDRRSIIENEVQLAQKVEKLLASFKQPVLIERYLPGREFTVAIIGNKNDAQSIGCMEIIVKGKENRGIYSYKTKEDSEELIEYSLAEDALAKKAEKIALKAYRGIGCRDIARVDMKTDENGVPNFMEINPIPGLHPTHSDFPMIASFKNIEYRQLMNSIIQTVLNRIGEENYG
jgi:D-alanine-D-alanine ligase